MPLTPHSRAALLGVFRGVPFPTPIPLYLGLIDTTGPRGGVDDRDVRSGVAMIRAGIWVALVAGAILAAQPALWVSLPLWIGALGIAGWRS